MIVQLVSKQERTLDGPATALPTHSLPRVCLFCSKIRKGSREMNFRKVLFATLATAFMLLSALPSLAVPDPLNCTGYPEPRTFMESQSWWEQTAGKSGTEYGHVDVGTCFPFGQTLTGNVNFDVRVVLYDEPGTLSTVELQLFGRKSGKVIAKASNVNSKCLGDAPCTLWFHLTGNTALYPADGRQEFRFHAIVNQPDGKKTMPSTGWQAYLKNGVSQERLSEQR